MEVDEIINSFVEPGSVSAQIFEELRAITSAVIEGAGELYSKPQTYIQYTSTDQIVDIFTKALNEFVSPPVPLTSPVVPPTPPVTPGDTSSLTVTGFYGPSLTANVLNVYLTQNAPVRT